MKYLRLCIFACLCACGVDGSPERPTRAEPASADQAAT